MDEIIFLKGDNFIEKSKRRIAKITASFKRKSCIKRISNYFLIKLSLLVKTPKVWGFPFYLMLEPTNLCNLKCPLCPTGKGTLMRQNGLMDFSVFKAAIDELGYYLLELNITNYGEPFIHNRLFEMIAYIKKKGIKVSVGTNGHYLDDEDKAKKLILSGVDEIYVSLDGTDQESYSRYRVGGNFEKVVKGLKLLVETKNKLKSKSPFVELQFLVMKHNEHQISHIRKLAKNIGVNRLILKPVSFNIAEWNNKEVRETFKEFEPKNKSFRLYHTVNAKLQWISSIKNRCDYLWRGTVILWDGTIVPCCLDPKAEYRMGKVADGIMKIWNNAKYINLRRQILKDKTKLPLCSHCPGT